MTTVKRMPVLFIGHGNPMYAIDDNAFTRRLAELGRELPRPKAIVCVSAHWMTEGTWVTGMAKPKTIHDFYGFPDELFAVQYPAPGDEKLAEHIAALVKDPQIHPDREQWGFDHGAWAVLKHMYPRADVPVVQISLHMEQPGPYHLQIGQRLRALRDEGILIVGSGNIVHNLRRMRWEDGSAPYPWAVEFDAWVKQRLERREFDALVNDYAREEAGRLSVPTPDHYYPLLYVLGASEQGDRLHFEYEALENASISMRCLSFGRV